MPHLSTVNRHKAIRGAAPGWHRHTAGLCVAAAGAALVGLLATPLAQADSDPAYGDLSTLYQDATSVANSYGSPEDEVFFSNLISVGNVLSASGLDLGDPFSSSATASDDLSTIEGEGAALTGQLTSVEADINDFDKTPGLAAVDSKELAVVGDALTFQQQINADVDSLPTITAQDETNPLLISELSALYTNQIDFGNLLTNNLADQLANGSVTGITDDNADILAYGLGTLVDTQSAADTLTVLADLSSLGL
jgi:hypothetical protein